MKKTLLVEGMSWTLGNGSKKGSRSLRVESVVVDWNKR